MHRQCSPARNKFVAKSLLDLVVAAVLVGTCQSEDPPTTSSARAAETSKCEGYAAALCAKQAACVGMMADTAMCVQDAAGGDQPQGAGAECTIASLGGQCGWDRVEADLSFDGHGRKS